MTIDYEELLNKEAFNSLEPLQKKAFIDLALKIKNKSISESMPIILDFMKNIPQGTTLSTEEQNLMLQTILDSLPEGDAIKFRKIIKACNLMNTQ